jgi:hypothetical protein
MYGIRPHKKRTTAEAEQARQLMLQDKIDDLELLELIADDALAQVEEAINEKWPNAKPD